MFLKPPADPDLGWHLRLGGFVLENHQFPWTNLFSYNFPDYRWADSYWLTQVMMVTLTNLVGPRGVSLLFAFIAAMAVGISARFNPFVSVLIALLLVPSVGVRPLVVSLLLFALLWLVLCEVQGGLNRRWLYFLPPLFLLWANIHADFVIGLLVLSLFLAIEAVRQREFATPVFVWGASILATLINPYGAFLWKTLFAEARSRLMRDTIAEWLPPNSHTDFGLYLLGFLFLLNLLFFLSRRRLVISETVLVALFSLLSLFSMYHIRLLTIIAAPFLVRSLKEVVRKFFAESSRGFLELYAAASLAVLALVVGPLFLGAEFWSQTADARELARAGGYPHAAVEFLRENPQEGNIFNDYVWGGYLIWQLPEVKTFIDGRMPAWEVNGESVLADYLVVAGLKPDWEDILQKYDVSYFLIKTDSILAQALRVHPGWELVYQDDLAVIFRKQ